MDIMQPSEGCGTGSIPVAGTSQNRSNSKSPYRPSAARVFYFSRADAVKIPVEVLVHQKTRALELRYEDGHAAVFSFEFLRVLSPSAEVQGHSPDQAVLQVGCRDVGLKGIEPVGQYALRLTFDDGHDSGLYSWDYFERLDREREALWADYLEALARAGASRDPGDPANAPFLARMRPKKGCGH